MKLFLSNYSLAFKLFIFQGILLVKKISITYRYIIACCAIVLMAMGSVQAQDKEELRLAITLEPSTLDPAVGMIASVKKITYQNIFEGLTQIDSNNRVQPGLAKSWEINEAGLIYTFTLRKNIFFHDRSELTATIVKASLERAIALNGNNSIKDKFNSIAEISVISRHVVRIKLTWCDGYLLYNLGLAGAVIQHPKSWGSNATNPVGTGPYRFVEWKKGEYIKLVVNHHYWGELGSIKNIKISMGQTRDELVDALMLGKLDGYSSMTEVDFLDPLFAIRQDYVLKTGNSSGKIILAMNHSNEMLSWLNVRLAINMVIDKKAIADTDDFIAGAEIGSHYSPNDFAYLDLSKAYSVNLAKAKFLLGRAEVPIKPLRLLSPPPAYAGYISKQIQTMLRDIGLTVSIEEVTWSEWLTRVYEDKDYDLTVIAHTESNGLDLYARDDYYFGYKSDKYKQIIRQLNFVNDEDKRYELLQEAQQQLSDDAVHAFLFMLPKLGVWHKDLRGYWLNEPIPAMIFSEMYWQE